MIIGILAILTIPSIMQVWEERANISKLKEAYSVLQQAYLLAELNYGSPDTWWIKPEGTNSSKSLDFFKPYLKIQNDCGTNGYGCSYDSATYLNNQSSNSYTNWSKVILLNGVAIYMYDTSPTCTGYRVQDNAKDCAVVFVDINGLKSPNQLGRDTFRFTLTKKGILPSGGQGPYYKHENSCSNTNFTGYGCAKWVIERGNMDYLHKNTIW